MFRTDRHPTSNRKPITRSDRPRRRIEVIEQRNVDITPENAREYLLLAQWEARKRIVKQYPLPTMLLVIAAICLITSTFFPYFRMELQAPQYPSGLSLQFYVNEVVGDVEEIDRLNHYVGMRPLEDAAKVERALSLFAITVVSMLVMAAIFVHSKWVVVFVLPAISYPFVFLLDLYFWLRLTGHNLDPTAPLSNYVEPFVQPLFGTVKVGNFTVTSGGATGFWLACLTVFIVVVALYFHRKAYKPLVDVIAFDLTDEV